MFIVNLVNMKKQNKKSKEDKNICGPGTHYDSKTNSCILDEKE